MTTQVLQTELNDIQNQIDALDLPGKNQRRNAMQAHCDSIRVDASSTPDAWKKDAAGNQAHRELQAAVTAHQLAEQAHRDLLPRATRLEQMLSAPALAAKAAEVMVAADAGLATAQAAVVDAQSTVATITAMIDTESAAFDLARNAHTEALLTSIKAGSSSKPLKAPGREQLAGLERALDAVQAELDAVVGAEKTAKEAHADAQQQVRMATSTGTALAHELALRDYVQVLLAHRQAHRAAMGFEFEIPNIEILAMSIEKENHE
ncbi:MAG: hypothetical protein ACOYNF_18895 [Rhodoferax sp.]